MLNVSSWWPYLYDLSDVLRSIIGRIDFGVVFFDG